MLSVRVLLVLIVFFFVASCVQSRPVLRVPVYGNHGERWKAEDLPDEVIELANRENVSIAGCCPLYGVCSWYSCSGVTSCGYHCSPGNYLFADLPDANCGCGRTITIKNLDNGRTVRVTRQDSGSESGRAFDLNHGPASALGMIESGVVKCYASC
jgi:hypothetical protein